MTTIGMRLHGGIDPQRCIELAKAAEDNHFASVWFAENPFERGVLPAAAACAALTRRIRIGIGVFNPFNRHPSLIAMEIGALDALTLGRAALGIGSGLAAPIARLGVDNKKPLAALRDTFHIVRGLMRGEEVNYSGTVFSANGVKLGYAPPRPDLPLFMAARGDKALALAGELADGLMISNMCPPGFTAHAVAVVGKARTAAGRSGSASVIQYVPCIANVDGNEARRAIKHALAPMLRQYWELGQRVATARDSMRHSGIPQDHVRVAVDRLVAGEAPEHALDDRFVDAFTIAGTAEQCRARIEDYARAGVTELVLTFVGAQPIADIAYLGGALAKRS